MKKLLLISLLLLQVQLLTGNPIIYPLISEIFFDDQTGAYTIEIASLSMYGIDNLDDLSLNSDAGAMYFRPGLTANLNGAILITTDSLLAPLYINPDGDHIYLSQYGYMIGMGLAFGNHSESEVTAPLVNESIVHKILGIMGPPYAYYWPIKNSPPTPGDSLYFTTSRGTLTGHLLDKNHIPIPGATLILCDETLSNFYPHLGPIETDSTGYFYNDQLYGKNYDVVFKLGSLTITEQELTVEIDSINYYEVVASYFALGIPDHYIVSDILKNHPNPFSRSAKLQIKINQKGYMECNLYDLSGKKVYEIFNDNILPGMYEFEIDGRDLKPGLYFCMLKTNEGTQTKKIIKL